LSKCEDELRLEVTALNNRLQQLEKIVLLQNDRITSLEKSNKDLERIVLEKTESVDHLKSVVKKLEALDTTLGTNENVNVVPKESTMNRSVVEIGTDRVIRDSTGNKDKGHHINRQGTVISLNVDKEI
jgi:exonuclease VII small subunit